MDAQTIGTLEAIARRAAKQVYGISETRINKRGMGRDDVRALALARGFAAYRSAPAGLNDRDRVRWVAAVVQNAIRDEVRLVARCREVPILAPVDHLGGSRDFLKCVEARDRFSRLRQAIGEGEWDLLVGALEAGSARKLFFQRKMKGTYRAFLLEYRKILDGVQCILDRWEHK